MGGCLIGSNAVCGDCCESHGYYEADDIDEQKRKETVAILYLMLNEHGEALKRLDED